MEDGTDLGQVSSTLQAVGVNVLDDTGAMRDMGTIFEDLMDVWGELDTASKQAVAVKVAGKYQYNRLLALMENSDMYEQYLSDAYQGQEEGTLDIMQGKYMESLEGKVNSLTASFEELITSLVNQDSFGDLIDGLRHVVELFTSLSDALGGISGILPVIVASMTKMFSGNLGQVLSGWVTSFDSSHNARDQRNEVIRQSRDILSGQGVSSDDGHIQGAIEANARLGQRARYMSPGQSQQYNELLHESMTRAARYANAQNAYAQAQVGARQRVNQLSEWDANLRDGGNLNNVKTAFRQTYGTVTPGSQGYQQFQALEAQLQQTVPNFRQLVATINNAGTSAQDTRAAIQELNTALQRQTTAEDQARASVQNEQAGLNDSLGSLNALDRDVQIQSGATALVEAGSGIMSLMSAVTSLQGAFSALSDEELSATEKIQQFATAGVTGVTMLASTVASLVNVVQLLRTGGGLAGLVTMVRMLLPLLPYIAGIGAVAGVGYAIYKSFTKATSAVADLEEKIEDTESSIQSLKNHASELSDEADNVASSFSSWQDSVSALHDLEQGTDEWKQQLQDANQQVLSLLETYPQLAKYINRGSDGLLSISAEGEQELVNGLREQAYQATENAALLAAQNAENRAQKDELILRNYFSSNSGVSGYDNAAYQKAVDALKDAYQNNRLDVNDEESIRKALIENGITSEQLQNAIISLVGEKSDTIIGYLESIANYEDAADIQSSEALSSYFDKQGITEQIQKYLGDSYDALNGALLDGISNAVNAAKQDKVAEYSDENEWTTEQLAQEYAARNGLDASTIEIDGDTVDFGSELTDVSRDMMIDYLSSADAMDAAAEKWQLVADALLAAYGASPNASDILGSYDSETGKFDFSSINDAELESFKDIGAGLYGADYQQAYVEALGLKNDTAKALSGDSNMTASRFAGMLANQIGAELRARDGIIDSMGDYDTSALSQNTRKLSDVKTTEGLIGNQRYDSDVGKLGERTEKLEELASAYPEVTEQTKKMKDAQEHLNDAIEENGEASEEAEEAAEDLALAQSELRHELRSQEWEKARVNIEKYNDVLSNGDKESKEYQNALQDIANQLTTLTGLDMPDDAQWVEDNKEAVQAWINNEEGAAARVSALWQMDANRDSVITQYQGQIDGLGEKYDALREKIANGDITFNMNGEADMSQILAALDLTEQAIIKNQDEATALAAVLSAFGGAEITLENDKGDLQSFQTPSADMTADEMSAWVENLQKSLSTGWHFKTSGFPKSGSRTFPVTSSSSGKSGGNSGGSGGGSSYTPKSKDKIEDEPDRYEEVNAHLDRLSNTLGKLADEQDRLTGKELLDNMREQIALIEEQAKWEQRKLEIQQQEAAELRGELSGYGIAFDEDGYMTNYSAIHQKLVNDVNSLIDQYNASSDEATQESLEEQIEAAEKRLDDFVESYERYDEIINNDILDTIKNLEDLKDQIEDLRIMAFENMIEAAEKIKDINDAWAEFMGFTSGYKPDSPFRSLIEDAQLYDSALKKLNADQPTLEQMLKWAPQYFEGGTITDDNPYGEDSAKFFEDFGEIYQTVIQDLLDVESAYYDQIDDVIDGYDDIADRISKRMESYAHLSEQLDHYASVIETIYGDEDYDNLLKLKRANQDVLESSITQGRMNLQMWQEQLVKYNKETQPELWQAAHDQVVNAQNELNDLVEQAAENTAEILEMAVDKTVKEWKDMMLGGDGDWMETQWELIKQNADQYLDDVEEAYEIEKLRSKYNSLANDTMDLNLRKRINEQMREELKYLNEKDKLSEYDVNYANAKLEILQKQIALEETLANKNQMKLRRDSQGNYSYVYAADKNDVEDARNDLLDSEFDAYEMSKENYLTNYDNYISAISAAAEQIKAINANTLLSEEEKAERTQYIYDNLKEYLSGVAEQVGVSEKGMLESIKYLAMDSSEIVGQNYADIAAMMEENWTEALATIGVAVSDEFDNIIHNMDDFMDATQEKWDEFEEHTQEWADNISDIADEGTDGFKDIDNVILDINSDMQDLNDSTEAFFKTINDDLGIIDAGVAKLQSYEEQLKGMRETTSAVRAELEETKLLLTQKTKEAEDWEAAYNNLKNSQASGGSGGSGSGGSGSGGSGTDELAWGIAQSIWTYGDGSGWGTDPTRSAKLTQAYSADFARKVQDYINAYHSSGSLVNYDSARYSSYSLLGYDTGGYTGSWGKDGKLALLHQKELVLNANDTENILQAVSAVRGIVDAMKSSSLQSLSGSFSNVQNISEPANAPSQSVEIYADFPAAESAAEIKSALEGLMQEASQYAYRRK